MIFAKYQFFWGGKQQDGNSTKEHVEVAKKSCFAAAVITEQTFDEVPVVVYCPEELDYIWTWFVKLDATRQNGMGVGPITYQEITAWANRMKIDLMPIETKAIRAIDEAYVIHSNTEAKKKPKHG